MRVFLGTLQYGQAKAVVQPIKLHRIDNTARASDLPFVTIRGRYGIGLMGHDKPVCIEPVHATLPLEGDHNSSAAVCVEQQRCRCLFVDCVPSLMKATLLKTPQGLANARAVVEEVVASIEKSSAAGTDTVKALLEDIRGQVSEAI